MDQEQPPSISSRECATGIAASLSVAAQPCLEQRVRVAESRVIPLQARDAALDEEARVAAELVRDIRAGKSSAEAAMIERYSSGLRYLLLRRVNDAELAQDLLHDTFCIAIVKLREIDLDNPERLAGYLRGIAIRVCLNAGRRQRREPGVENNDIVERIPDRTPRQFEQLSKEQTLTALRKLLRSMPVARDRELLTRLYVHDEDKQEICSALGLDSLHFNRVLHRAKNRFRKLLENTPEAADLSVG